MEFPTLVYRCPGTHQRPGGTFAYRDVKDAEQFDAAIKEGWFATLPEAIEGKPKEPPVIDDTPPTRAEMEQKATELGITFSPNIGDKKLAERIAEALAKE